MPWCLTSSTITPPSSRRRCLRMFGSVRALSNPMCVLDELVEEPDGGLEELGGQGPALVRRAARQVREPGGVAEHVEPEEDHHDDECHLLAVDVSSLRF